MGEPQQVSALPLPPMQYIKEYSDENVRKGLAPKPPLPIRDNYMMFGNQFQCDDLIIRPLESQGIERLHPVQFDHKRELKKLNMSILVNFLDLLDILIKSPGSIKREEKLEDLKLLFVHMHHLINEYPPPPGEGDAASDDGGTETAEAGDGRALSEAPGAGGGDDPRVPGFAAR
ncbi:hypothetical protein P4O66_003755 [Electrophorus voltai]|uniref:Mediator of RNA polymerase II transcription subunit 7 n=1 Tax=Electrophorus voltai TaxID=2609070 RepID=A0AAD9E4D0_9TELE|nr:hypothetical protein P4O66_003755 [Electrophorus voltai]